MSPKTFLSLSLSLITIIGLAVFSPLKASPALAYYCPGSCMGACGEALQGCGSGTSCASGACCCAIQCSPVNGDWGGCTASNLLSYCSGANGCGSQNCSPAGGYRTCCSSGATATLTVNYPGSYAATTPWGAPNGTINITGGTTTISSGTLDFSVLNVTTGYILVNGGVIKTSTACD